MSEISFVQFDGAETNSGEVYTGEWSKFVEELVELGHARAKDKLSITLLVPAIYQKDSPSKSEQWLKQVTMGALDFDNLTDQQLETVVGCLDSEKLEAVVYSTWGHSEAFKKHGKYKIRIIVQFSRPVDKDEWPFFWRGFNGLFQGLGDTQCKDPTRGYFLPAAPEDADEDSLFIFHHPGKPLDVDHMVSSLDSLRVEDLIDYAEEGKQLVDREQLERVAKRWRRQVNHHPTAHMGDVLMKVIKGVAYAASGERDKVTYQLGQDLGAEFPNASARSIAEHFELSLSLMGAGAPTVEGVCDKIRRAQHSKRVEYATEQRRQLIEAQTIKKKLKVSVYDKECIEAFSERTGSGSTFETFNRRLIILKGTTYYIFTGDGYLGPVTGTELQPFCRDYFIPGRSTLGATVYNVSDKGLSSLKSQSQLVDEYGIAVRSVEMRADARTSYYHEDRGIFIEGMYPPADIEPEQVPEVDAWIDAICPTEFDRENLRDWMAAVTDLNRPLSMLTLIGPAGLGKTAFATGVSRLWGDAGWVPMGTMLTQDYNDDIRQNPVLLADEAIPTDARGAVPSAKLRSLISSDKHNINGKFQARLTMRGYLRTIVAVNSMENVSFGKIFNREDIDAVAKRLLIIDVNSISEEQRAKAVQAFNYEKFVMQRGIAKHCLWLQQVRPKSTERFATKSQGAASFAKIAIKSSAGTEVLDWCLWYLKNRRLDQDKDLPAFITKRQLYVNAHGVSKHWEDCFARGRSVSENAVAKAIKQVSGGSLRIRRGGSNVRYQMVDSQFLREYALESDWLASELDRQLDIFTELWSKPIALTKELRPTEEEVRLRERALSYEEPQSEEPSPSLAALHEIEEMEVLQREQEEQEQREREYAESIKQLEGDDEDEDEDDDDPEMLTDDNE